MENSNELNLTPSNNTLSIEKYTKVLKDNGLDPNAPGLLQILIRKHSESLTYGLVSRAYAEWRSQKNKAKDRAKSAEEGKNEK
ncbi:hypothetical protein [Ruficoccus sp. ZRK36]|uniref:hypothetical protein n=1 Tax=Ruficoccus sp. ZRK36 TaxID=2866311 RepID=UPI001C737DAE|nr:hypothetical protein [Ruficoccus sp. ZRK36]QYY37323.1 hypothetical protein K0V07_07510 [Ruficoccus sp. ZRK36]